MAKGSNADIGERQKEVVGDGPRIAAIPAAEVDGAALDVMNQIRLPLGLQPLTEIPAYSRTMLKNRPIFERQIEMGTTIFAGTIPARERELIVLRTAWVSQTPYAWGEHVDLGKRYGITDEDIERIIVGSSAIGWTKQDAAILRGVEELMMRYTLTDNTWTELRMFWDERQLIEFPMVVGQYLATSLTLNSLRIALAPDNEGLLHR